MISKRASSLFATLLCAMLALTAHAGAGYHNGGLATGQMVICTGKGTTTVHVDANGQPTSAPHICPDCIVAHNDGSAVPFPDCATDVSKANLQAIWSPFEPWSDPGAGVAIRGPPKIG